MQIIMHRRNTPDDLEATPESFGVEMDIRSFGADLVVHHEPFVRGVRLEEWLEHFHHRTLILNVKEEGLEERVLLLMRRHGIEDFFFLDQSFPFLVKTAKSGERRCAVRVSEYESVETVLNMAPLIDWVWVDCFSRFPLEARQVVKLQAAGLKLCLVSPELQGFGKERIRLMRQLLAASGIQAEAVCTKYPNLWQC
ncbi:MAG: hypothetical protein K2O70_00895 [Desulfovibrionaceae bacterium]|nr:hypothetical protein [Desulfovibrionaceae bacterium]